MKGDLKLLAQTKIFAAWNTFSLKNNSDLVLFALKQRLIGLIFDLFGFL